MSTKVISEKMAHSCLTLFVFQTIAQIFAWVYLRDSFTFPEVFDIVTLVLCAANFCFISAIYYSIHVDIVIKSLTDREPQ